MRSKQALEENQLHSSVDGLQPTELYDRFKEFALNQLDSLFDSSAREAVRELERVKATGKNILKQVDPKKPKSTTTAKLLEQLLRYYSEIIGGSSNINKQVERLKELCIDEWQSALTSYAVSIPLEIELEINHREYIANAPDYSNRKVNQARYYLRHVTRDRHFLDKSQHITVRIREGFVYCVGMPLEALRWKVLINLFELVSTAQLKLQDIFIVESSVPKAKKKALESYFILDGEAFREDTSDYIKTINSEIEKLLFGLTEDIATLKEETKQKVTEIFETSQTIWHYAGSVFLPPKKLTDYSISINRWKLASTYQSPFDVWRDVMVNRYSDFCKDLELIRLQYEWTSHTIITVNGCVDRLNREILVQIQETAKIAGTVNEKLKTEHAEDLDQFKASVESSSNQLLENLQQVSIPKMVQGVVRANLQVWLEQYHKNLLKSIERLSKKHVLVKEKGQTGGLPRIKTDLVEFKDIILFEFNEVSLLKYERLQLGVKEKLDILVRSISDLDQLLSVNVEAGLSVIKDLEDQEDYRKAYGTILDGYTRLLQRISELEIVTTEIQQVILEKSEDLLTVFCAEINQLSDSEEMLELRLRATRVSAIERLEEVSSVAWSSFKKVVRNFVEWIPKILFWGQARVDRIKKITGLYESNEETAQRLISMLKSMEDKIHELPYVYQQLFRQEPLKEEHFYLSRENEMAAVEQSYRSWKLNNRESIAITGEKGCGITSLVNIAKRNTFASELVVTVELSKQDRTETNLIKSLKNAMEIEEDVSDFEAFESVLGGSNQQRIVILENIQNLYLRTVDGFDTIEKLMAFISRTDKNILWVLTCSTYAWKYLDNLVQVSNYVRRHLPIKPFDRANLESILMKRHYVSGFGMMFLFSEDQKKQRQFQKLQTEDERIKYGRHQLFDKIFDVSQGNVSVALLLFLQAIHRIHAGNVEVRTSVDFDSSVLLGLNDEELFTLAALVLHTGLSVPDDAIVFRRSERVSYRILTKLETLGLIQRDGEIYLIRTYLFKPIVRLLYSRKILH